VTLLAPAPAAVAAPAAGIAPRRLWRRVWQRTVLVPLIVLAPLVALAPTADHRFNLYWHGGMFRDHPLRIVPHTLHSIPGYLTLGNFRPLGRMLEKSLDLIAYTLTDVSGVPVNVTFRLVSFAAAIVLTAVAVLLAECMVARGRLFVQPPSTLAATVPFAVGAGFVAAGSASPAVLFGGLYLLSAALVLGAAAVVARLDERLGWWRTALLVLAGAALASFNEVACLAVPFATVVVVIRQRWILRRTGWRAASYRAVGLLWLGFLPVFGAVRLIIRGYCAAGECYRGSDVVLGVAAIEAVPVRMTAWFPPLMWQAGADRFPRQWLIGAAALVALLWLAGQAVRDLPGLTPVGRRPAIGLAVAALLLLVLGATLGALNADVQALRIWGQGWRDTAVTAPAGALLLTALPHSLGRRRRWLAAVLVVLALTGTASAMVNKTYRDRLGTREPALLANRIAGEMTDFDRSPAGDARRCAMRAEFRTLYAASAFSRKRFDQSLDVAARQQAGVPFCRAGR
jgi:hypothetical protein